ncbi:omptin family outer membrane protease [Brucella anthropi]|uniref:omptin family outer membrane protease n=1 Tax=Brucella anthropi TaxID=529 RepID=UPI001F31C057|nr:omptin family outer membrane protease [Brucella anthropi]
MKKLIFFVFLYSLNCSNAISADISNKKTTDINYTFSGGIGYSWIKADEIVYDQDNRISHLIWKSQMPVLSGKITADIGSDLTFSGNLKVGLTGSGNLHDYDWLSDASGFSGYDFNNWTDHSQSETDLDRYISFDVALGHNFVINPQNTLNIHGGFKYTNVKWTASGGDYVYSSKGFRDTTSTLPDGKVISYEQRLPALFIGSEWTTNVDRWSFSALGRAGLTVSGKDLDDHWLRDLHFIDTFNRAPFFELQANASYSFNEQTSLYVTAGFEKHMKMRGDTQIFDHADSTMSFASDGAGASLQAATVSAGLKVKF